jgi:hypothetical protein
MPLKNFFHIVTCVVYRLSAKNMIPLPFPYIGGPGFVIRSAWAIDQDKHGFYVVQGTTMD